MKQKKKKRHGWFEKYTELEKNYSKGDNYKVIIIIIYLFANEKKMWAK